MPATILTGFAIWLSVVAIGIVAAHAVGYLTPGGES